jgi:hypothetical protein
MFYLVLMISGRSRGRTWSVPCPKIGKKKFKGIKKQKRHKKAKTKKSLDQFQGVRPLT